MSAPPNQPSPGPSETSPNSSTEQIPPTTPTVPVVTASSAEFAADRQNGLYRQGDVIGRYIAISVLGQGGMGSVYLAYDPELDRRVAIKVLLTSRTSERARKRLVREARALARLSHPNVVQVYDAGIHNDDVFVAMEFVAGTSVRQWCQSDSPPDWRQVLKAYIEAGKGLAAAHDKGLIHRDIKPANLLRGTDGRVRVADFGLARGHRDTSTDIDANEETVTPDTSTGDSVASLSSNTAKLLAGRLDEELTRTGTLMGTPAYMAPEQHYDGTVAAAADQYSFCVALYEGLYGRLPFSLSRGHRNGELAKRKITRALVAPPPDSPVPSWVYQALSRGLAPQPADRHPSMRALLAVLESDPATRKRTRWRRIALVSSLMLLLGLVTWNVTQRWIAASERCQGVQRELAGIWDQQIRDKVRKTFVATGLSYAANTADLLVEVLDDYANHWVAMRGELCEIRQHSIDITEHVILSLQDICLEQRRGQIKAFITVFVEDNAEVSKAIQSAQKLPPIEYCADIEALTTRVRPPEDPVLRARVDAYRHRVDRLEALYNAGKYQTGLSESESLLGDLENVNYAPLRALVYLWGARLTDGAGDYTGAEAHLRQAIHMAAQGGDALLVARSWIFLLYVVGYRQNRFEEANNIMEWLNAVVLLANDREAVANSLNVQAIVLARQGKYEPAQDMHRQALEIWEQLLPQVHVYRAMSMDNLAIVLNQQGKYQEALKWHQRAFSIRKQLLGPEHPVLAMSLGNLSMVHVNLGNYREARSVNERALAIAEKALGPTHPYVASALNKLGNVLRAMGLNEQAKAHYERSLSIREDRVGPSHTDIAGVLHNLGAVFYAQGNYESARAMYTRSLAMFEDLLAPKHPFIAYPLTGLGRTLVRLGALGEASKVLNRARKIRQAVDKNHPTLAETFLGEGELWLARKRPGAAVERLEQALAVDNGKIRPAIQLALARALWAKADDTGRARALVEKATTYYRSIEHQPRLAEIAQLLAKHAHPQRR